MNSQILKRGLATTARAVSDKDAVIVSFARTPIACFNGAFASVKAPQLGSTAIRAAIERANIQPEDVEECYMGNVVSAGIGQAPTRQAVLGAGLPNTVPCTTINKVCASGMKATAMAAQSIMLGHKDIMVAGGFESMSNIPYYLPQARSGLRLGDGKIVDGLVFDGLWDPYDNQHMGMCAEACSTTFGFSREDQDAYAISSYERAMAAQKAGIFAKEITPFTVKDRRGEKQITEDEEIHRSSIDKISKLKPAFKRDGVVTAGNASTINDGAAAMVIMSAKKAKDLGLSPLARILGFGDAARLPLEFTIAPSDAVPIAAKMAGLQMTDIEYHEINEAFAVVALANMRLMNLSHDRVNVHGGAVAIGHPIGMSGARIVGSLYTVLKEKDATIGCASICNGGGGAGALIIERLN